MRPKRLAMYAGLSMTVLVGMQTTVWAKGQAPQTLVIGVDHVDPANQQLGKNRWFEYTDFFSRNVSVRQGEVLDFQLAPGNFGHAIAVAGDAAAARRVFPLVVLDAGDNTPAIATGKPKIEDDTPGGFSITGGNLATGSGQIGTDPTGATPPPCGAPTSATPVCSFTGANDVEGAGPMFGTDPSGNPVTIDWKIAINAPPGDYDYLCFFHPGMQGRLHVAPSAQAVTSQAENDLEANIQFQVDRGLGRGAEAAADVPRFSGGLPGTRTYEVNVGVGAADNHLAVLEMLPQTLNLVDGDKVNYRWRTPNEVHSVGFPARSTQLPFPFGFDCGATFENPTGPPCIDPSDGRPEGILDPGTTPSGSPLTSTNALVDAGVLIGTGYNVSPTAQQWAATTNSATPAGTYAFQCTVHDVMRGQLVVRTSR